MGEVGCWERCLNLVSGELMLLKGGNARHWVLNDVARSLPGKWVVADKNLWKNMNEMLMKLAQLLSLKCLLRLAAADYCLHLDPVDLTDTISGDTLLATTASAL
jgi:hypothetical protein